MTDKSLVSLLTSENSLSEPCMTHGLREVRIKAGGSTYSNDCLGQCPLAGHSERRQAHGSTGATRS